MLERLAFAEGEVVQLIGDGGGHDSGSRVDALDGVILPSSSSSPLRSRLSWKTSRVSCCDVTASARRPAGGSQDFLSKAASMERNVAKLFTEKVKIFGHVEFKQVGGLPFRIVSRRLP